MKKTFFILVILITSFTFCTYYSEEELYPDSFCDTTNISYSIDIKPILQQNCYLCHSSSVEFYGNLNFEDSVHVQRVVDNGRLLRNIKHEPDGIPMPQGAGKLSDCKINKIEAWVNRGIPFNN